jgi:uncharacterized protein (TIGR00251 family)
MALQITPQKDGSLLVGLKVVPGASRQRIVGLHGDRLKVAVSAPPEAGKANVAVCRLLAETLGLATRNVTLHAGGGTPFKTIRVVGLTAEQFCQRLGL